MTIQFWLGVATLPALVLLAAGVGYVGAKAWQVVERWWFSTRPRRLPERMLYSIATKQKRMSYQARAGVATCTLVSRNAFELHPWPGVTMFVFVPDAADEAAFSRSLPFVIEAAKAAEGARDEEASR